MEAARHAIRERPDFVEARLVRASALGYLGRADEAQAELEECQRLDPDFTNPLAIWRRFRSQEIVEYLFDGLRKAGRAE